MPTQTLTGSCLCGAIEYSITGEPSRFYHCHCSRCRKATGTGHASNLFVTGGALGWGGEIEARRLFKLPEAERFSRSFCAHCGGPLPREIPQMNMTMIPAGTLNEEPNILPQARIFQGSKARWSCSEEAIEAFETYPD